LIPGVIMAGGSGTTGAAFLKLGMDAHSAAMGGIQAVSLEGSGAIFGNPAGLISSQNVAFSLSYASWFQSIRFGALSGVYPKSPWAFGVGAIYLDYGDIAGYDNNANPTGNFGANDLCAMFGVAHDFGKTIAVGSSVKFLSERIESNSATGLGLDLGACYRFRFIPLRLGVVAQHIGLVEMKFVEEKTPWPTTLRFGAAYSMLDSSLSFTAEGLSVLGDAIYFNGGAEYCFKKMISVRAGYRTGPSDLGSGFCAGLGLQWKLNYGFSYAFEPYGELGDTHRFTFMVAL